MNLTEYQETAKTTAIYPEQAKCYYPALGLAGEAGEVANKVKKMLRDGVVADLHAVSKEIGDCLWYLAALATDFGLSLAEIATENLAKLKSRQERGVLQGSGDNR